MPGHTKQERYSALVDIKLRATLVKRNGVIFNTRFEGNPKAGSVKVPVRDTEVTVANYSNTSGVSLTHGDTDYLTVTIDKDKAVNELIDGFDAAAVPDNLVADRLDSAGYSLALQMEMDATDVLEGAAVPSTGITKYDTPKLNGQTTAGTSTTLAIDGVALEGKLVAGEKIQIGTTVYTIKEDSSAAATNAISGIKVVEPIASHGDNADVTILGAAALAANTIYEAFVDARTRLSKMNVPTDRRFALVTPETYALLLKDKDHFVHATQLGDQVIATGAVGRIAGFTVYEDNTLSAATCFIVGHPDWCTRIEEWQVPVHVQALDQSGTYIGATAVQGRKIYAHAVTKGQTLYRKVAI
jgi:hypothetical protein